jgi:hypothetical protein
MISELGHCEIQIRTNPSELGHHPGPNRNNSGTQNNWRIAAYVAFGSLAAAAAEICGVRFTPESCRGCRRMARRLKANNCREQVQQK